MRSDTCLNCNQQKSTHAHKQNFCHGQRPCLLPCSSTSHVSHKWSNVQMNVHQRMTEGGEKQVKASLVCTHRNRHAHQSWLTSRDRDVDEDGRETTQELTARQKSVKNIQQKLQQVKRVLIRWVLRWTWP